MKRSHTFRHARVGEPVSLSFKAGGLTGHQWVLLDPVGARWRPLSRVVDPGRNFGAAPTVTWEIEMLSPGVSEIEAVLKRPWEAEPIEQITITFDVED